MAQLAAERGYDLATPTVEREADERVLQACGRRARGPGMPGGSGRRRTCAPVRLAQAALGPCRTWSQAGVRAVRQMRGRGQTIRAASPHCARAIWSPGGGAAAVAEARRSGGTIVNISSGRQASGAPTNLSGSGSTGAMTRHIGMARELAATGVVNAVSPGMTKTDIQRALLGRAGWSPAPLHS